MSHFCPCWLLVCRQIKFSQSSVRQSVSCCLVQLLFCCCNCRGAKTMQLNVNNPQWPRVHTDNKLLFYLAFALLSPFSFSIVKLRELNKRFYWPNRSHFIFFVFLSNKPFNSMHWVFFVLWFILGSHLSSARRAADQQLLKWNNNSISN